MSAPITAAPSGSRSEPDAEQPELKISCRLDSGVKGQSLRDERRPWRRSEPVSEAGLKGKSQLCSDTETKEEREEEKRASGAEEMRAELVLSGLNGTNEVGGRAISSEQGGKIHCGVLGRNV